MKCGTTGNKWSVILAIVLIMLFATCAVASAETERGNLADRFDDEVVLVHREIEYRLRSRMTTMAFVGVVKDEAAQCYRSEMLILLAVDDNQKLMTPIMIEEAILGEPIEIPSASGSEEKASLPEIDGVKEMCEGILQRINAFLPAELIEHYVVMDLDGLSVMDGLDTDDYENRMRAIKAQAEGMSSGEISDLMARLSDYLVTDMKSGAFIKIIDKSERYERSSTMRWETAETLTEEEQEALLYEPEVFTDMVVKVFFEEKFDW